LIGYLRTNRGWTDAELRKLAGENLLRVFRAVEQVNMIHLRYVEFDEVKNIRLRKIYIKSHVNLSKSHMNRA